MILITGATGFIGKRLLKRISKSEKIRCLARNGSDLPKNVETVLGDLSDKDALRKATKDISCVIHLAAVINSTNKTDFYKVNHIGTKNLIEACKKNGVKRVILISSYDVVMKPGNDYTKSKLLAENVVKKSGLDYIILRPTAVYGPNDKGLSTLFQMIKKYPIAPVAGDGNYQLQPAYVGDVVDCIIRCVKSPKFGKTYFVAGPKPVSFNEIIDTAAKACSKKVIKLHIPMAILRIVLFPMKLFSKSPRLSYEKFKLIVQSKTCDISETRKDLKFKPISFEEGVRRTIRYGRDNGF